MKSSRHASLQAFEGNVWQLPTAATATAVYQSLLRRFMKKDPAEWSLVNGFFQHQPVLAFLWDPTRNAVMAKAVAAASFAGGQELEAEAKEELLT
jgi:hypothetical protein